MKTKMLVVLLGGLVLVAGCVSTVNDRNNGAVARESIINPGPTQARTIEAKVNGRNVWVRVEAVDPNVSSVIVQARTKAGGSDQELTHELEKQIALQLASR